MNIFVLELLDALCDSSTSTVSDAHAADNALTTISSILSEVDTAANGNIVRMLRFAHKTFMFSLEGCFRAARSFDDRDLQMRVIEHGSHVLSTWLELHPRSINFVYHSDILFGTIIPESWDFIESQLTATNMFGILRHYILGRCDYIYSSENEDHVEELGSAFAYAAYNTNDMSIQTTFFNDIEYFKSQQYAVDYIYVLEQGVEKHLDDFWWRIDNYVADQRFPRHGAVSNYVRYAKVLTYYQAAFVQIEAIHCVWKSIELMNKMSLAEEEEDAIDNIIFPDLQHLRRFPRMTTRGRAPARNNNI